MTTEQRERKIIQKNCSFFFVYSSVHFDCNTNFTCERHFFSRNIHTNSSLIGFPYAQNCNLNYTFAQCTKCTRKARRSTSWQHQFQDIQFHEPATTRGCCETVYPNRTVRRNSKEWELWSLGLLSEADRKTKQCRKEGTLWVQITEDLRLNTDSRDWKVVAEETMCMMSWLNLLKHSGKCRKIDLKLDTISTCLLLL